jgi:hypothetical protein
VCLRWAFKTTLQHAWEAEDGSLTSVGLCKQPFACEILELTAMTIAWSELLTHVAEVMSEHFQSGAIPVCVFYFLFFEADLIISR